jgi:hypothetical protein
VITGRGWADKTKSRIDTSGTHNAKRSNRVLDPLSWGASADEHKAKWLS